jgi:hypothetical protein
MGIPDLTLRWPCQLNVAALVDIGSHTSGQLASTQKRDNSNPYQKWKHKEIRGSP